MANSSGNVFDQFDQIFTCDQSFRDLCLCLIQTAFFGSRLFLIFFASPGNAQKRFKPNLKLFLICFFSGDHTLFFCICLSNAPATPSGLIDVFLWLCSVTTGTPKFYSRWGVWRNSRLPAPPPPSAKACTVHWWTIQQPRQPPHRTLWQSVSARFFGGVPPIALSGLNGRDRSDQFERNPPLPHVFSGIHNSTKLLIKGLVGMRLVQNPPVEHSAPPPLVGRVC